MPARELENGYEDQRRAREINVLLEQIGLSDGRLTEWWNHMAYPELGNRTPTRAWLAGDRDAVQLLVEKWFADTAVVGERLLAGQGFMDSLRSKLDKLRTVVQ